MIGNAKRSFTFDEAVHYLISDKKLVDDMTDIEVSKECDLLAEKIEGTIKDKREVLKLIHH